jgi:hypothetical protein
MQHDVESGELVLTLPLRETAYSIAWSPAAQSSSMLAWAGDDRNAANQNVLTLLAPPLR